MNMTDDKKSQGAPAGNTNAAKPPEQARESRFTGRCKTSDKAMWVKSAQRSGLNLTDWMIEAMNSYAEKNIEQFRHD